MNTFLSFVETVFDDFLRFPLWDSFLASVMVFILVFAVILPVVHFLRVSWRHKRDEMMNYFDDNAIHLYIQQFLPTETAKSNEEARVLFGRVYDAHFGRIGFAAPLTLLAATLLSQAIIVTTAVLSKVGYLPPQKLALPEIAIAAIAGGYMWVLSDFIARMHRRHFARADIYYAVLRLVIAVPLGFAFTDLLPIEKGTLFIAFALGAFPLGPIMSILRRLTYKRLGIEDTGNEATDQPVKLQGINAVISERLQNEDIFTITQLASEDPIRLTMRTNLSFNFILECISQALAWMYLGDNLDKIRPFGLRGAHEIKSLMDESENIDPDQGQTADAKMAIETFSKVAGVLNVDETLLRNAFNQIRFDPYTVFLHAMYR